MLIALLTTLLLTYPLEIGTDSTTYVEKKCIHIDGYYTICKTDVYTKQDNTYQVYTYILLSILLLLYILVK